MRLNPLKCAFSIASKTYLVYMVNRLGKRVNPEKINALLDMRSPNKPKEVQSLTGRLVVFETINRCLLFIKILKGRKRFQWSEECELAF